LKNDESKINIISRKKQSTFEKSIWFQTWSAYSICSILCNTQCLYYDALDNGKKERNFLDVAKAFDTINHNTLTHILSNFETKNKNLH